MTLFTQSFKEIHFLDKSEHKLDYATHLFEDCFKIVEKCLTTSSVQKTIAFLPALSFIVQIYFSSAVRLLANHNILKTLLKIIDLIQKP